MATGRLLIVDDDDTVGQILVAGAAQCGFEARLCTTPGALAAVLPAWAPTHLSIDLSLDLPGATPEALLQQVSDSGARPRVIVCSGANRGAIEAALGLASALGLPVAGALPKPFRIAALRALLLAP